MEPGLWVEVHGATTHFPIALIFAAALADTAALLWWMHPVAGQLRAAGAYAICAAAFGSVPAVVSGLVLTRGEMLGPGALGWHHLFAWPAFTLLIAVAVWRALRGAALTRGGCAGYLGAVYALAALIAATGRWGGALLHAFP